MVDKSLIPNTMVDKSLSLKTIPIIHLEAPIEGSGVKNPNVAFAHIQD
jgi:hypothetical protein